MVGAIDHPHHHQHRGSTITTLALSGSIYEDFKESIRSEATRCNYVYALKKYMQYQKVTKIEDLLPSSPSPNTSEIRLIESDIIKYIIHLKNIDKLGCGTIQGYLSAIEHFYIHCADLNLNKKKISRYLPEPKKTADDRGYNREEIAKMIESSDSRLRTLILLLASTGIRIGAIPDIKLKHLHKISEHKLYKVVVYAGYKEEYFCFCTPETAKAIDTYLQYRERYGEGITPDSFLFREQFNIEDILDCKNPKKMHLKALSSLIADAAVKTGVIQKGSLLEGERFGTKRNKIFRTHGFRKFVNTTMINIRLNDTIRNMLLGHSIDLDDNYYKPKRMICCTNILKLLTF
jgi:integrase